jgi:hypothetical protein
VTDYDELTWDEAMRRGHAALLASERLYHDINASEGRSNIDIEKHLRRSEVKAAQAQAWLALARELGSSVAKASATATSGRDRPSRRNIQQQCRTGRDHPHQRCGQSRPGPLDYRRSTVQVTVRVTPSTAWIREATSLPRSSSPGAWILAMTS